MRVKAVLAIISLLASVSNISITKKMVHFITIKAQQLCTK